MFTTNLKRNMRARLLITGLTGLALTLATTTTAASAAAVVPLNPAVEVSSMVCPTLGDCSAVGEYTDGAGNGQGLLLSQSNGVWKTTEAELPANAGIDPMNFAFNTGIADLSCVSVGNCAAVGVYTDDTNQDRGLLLSESHGRWQRGVEVKLPGNAAGKPKKAGEIGDNLLVLGVSCVSAGNCYAVGNYVTSSNTLLPLIIHQQNGVWGHGTVAPLPAGATVRGQDSTIFTIKCLPDGTCAAAGSYTDGNGDKQAMLLGESGGLWSAATEATLPSDANTSPTAIPIALDCAATGDCDAVGIYEDSHSDSLGLLLSETGGTWAAGTEPTLPANAAPPTSYNAQTTLLDSITCPDAQDCAAVGSYTDTDANTQALLLNETAGTWAAGQQVVLPTNANTTATDQSAALDSVSCPTAGNCVAGGQYTDTAQNDDSMLVTETNGVWSNGVEVPLPNNAGQQAQFSAIDSVRCADVGDCSALGTYSDHSGGQYAFAINESGNVWGSPATVQMPAITKLQIQTAVYEMLTPTGKDATVAAIRKAGSFKLAYSVLEPGKLQVVWSAGKKSNSPVIATGHASDKTIGTTSLLMHLTTAGKQLFRHGGKIKLFAGVEFSPTGKKMIVAAGSFTLK